MFLGLKLAEQWNLFSLPKTEQNKNKRPKSSTVFLMRLCFRHDWKNAYACDFLLQMSEGWRYWTQHLVKCTESVTIETSMSSTYFTIGYPKWHWGCILNVQQENPTLSSWYVNVWPLSRQNSLAKLQHRKFPNEDGCKAGFLMMLLKMWHKTLAFTLKLMIVHLYFPRLQKYDPPLASFLL